ncbi:MFS transporter [Microtetraspora sp. NBRC 16547]|uniref:MFS transporter n=1 Tax=Microtetraspora sp. NBRC 16547 TaxID=3030993 RepID=UPI0024A3E0A7|nr:MFS transporter [Microtetraspora sp. NBRC 16547]GLW98294.1 MFS transporter [Microtetraspora sp. NBRC 16547]
MALDTQRLIRRLSWRIVPLIFILYIIAYVDRSAVSFAALTMNADLGLSASAYGLGASMFFISYLLFEVPSNLLLVKFGPRKWIARILVTWGIVTVATFAIQDEIGLYVARFLLGAAEAGFFPAIILYISWWFPRAERTKITTYFMLAVPVSSVIGAPLATATMTALDGALMLEGWRWVFLVLGAPAVIMGFVCLKILKDQPRDAKWLRPEESSWLEMTLAAEKQEMETVKHYSLREGLTNPRVLLLAAVLLLWNCCNYGIIYWLPQIINAVVSDTQLVGWIVAAAWTLAAIGMALWGVRANRTTDPVVPMSIVYSLGAVALFAAGSLAALPILQLVALITALIGLMSGISIFWSIPTAFLTGTAAAGGVALINSVGNFSGVIAPWGVGVIYDATGGYSAAMYIFGGLLVVSVLLAYVFRYVVRRDRIEAKSVPTVPAEQ